MTQLLVLQSLWVPEKWFPALTCTSCTQVSRQWTPEASHQPIRRGACRFGCNGRYPQSAQRSCGSLTKTKMLLCGACPADWEMQPRLSAVSGRACCPDTDSGWFVVDRVDRSGVVRVLVRWG